jgi:hypothetical protein
MKEGKCSRTPGHVALATLVVVLLHLTLASGLPRPTDLRHVSGVLEGAVRIHNDERPFAPLRIELLATIEEGVLVLSLPEMRLLRPETFRPLLVKDQPFHAMVNLDSDAIAPGSRGEIWGFDAGGVEVVTYTDRLRYESARVFFGTIAFAVLLALVVSVASVVRRSFRKR